MTRWLAWLLARLRAEPGDGAPPAAFASRPLLGRTEARLYRMVAARLPQGARLMAQVSYGEMLRCADRRRYWLVAALRADMVAVDAGFHVLAVIEYQGEAHHGFSMRSARAARRRDRLKRRALEEAGMPLVEIRPGFDGATVAAALEAALPPAPSRPEAT